MALTKLTETELAAFGARLRVGYLIQQAGYTISIAHEDGDELAKLLPKGFLDATEHLREEVDHARQDKDNAAAEAKLGASAQDAQLQHLKVWRRKVAKRAARARRLGQDIPIELTVIGSARTVTEVLDDASSRTRLLSDHLAKITEATGDGAKTLLEEGQALYKSLSGADVAQETKRLAGLPAAVQKYFAKKGELYTAIKAINDAGHELHANHPILSARYSLKILHRGRSTPPTTAPGQTAPAPAPHA